MIIKISRAIMKKRQYILFGLFVIIFMVLYYRIVRFQYFNSDKLSVMADNQYTSKEDLTDVNFSLFDCNGKEMLKYDKKYFAVIYPQLFSKNNLDKDSDGMLTLMYILRNYKDEYDLSKAGVLNSSQKLYYEVDENTYNKLKKLKDIKGFYVYNYSALDKSDTWKVENLIVNTKKTDGSSLKSKGSLEMQVYNKTKNNKKPQIVFDRDVNGKIIAEKAELPKDNVNVRLTLDRNMSDKIKEILLNEKNKKYKQVGVVLMESDTGKIKAMVQKDDLLSNANIGVATNHGFFPGSIFKIIVEEAGLDRKSINLGDKFTCKKMYEEESHKSHGTVSPEEALIVSCNDAFAQIGNKVGFNNFYDNAKSQGLFDVVLGLDEEKHGNFEVKDPKFSDGTLGIASIGQNVRITPIEAVSIANTVANGGIYVKPHIIDAYVDANNKEVETLNVEKRAVIENSTASALKNQMLKVVNYGTGQAVKINNIEVGGKTGSTERIEIPNAGAKPQEYSDGWFVGFFNIKGKYYSMVVFVQDIDKDGEEGANTAAPIFKEIITNIQN